MAIQRRVACKLAISLIALFGMKTFKMSDFVSHTPVILIVAL